MTQTALFIVALMGNCLLIFRCNIPKALVIVEEQEKPKAETPKPPETKPPEIPKNKEKEIITIPPCPDPKQPLRVGSYANSQN